MRPANGALSWPTTIVLDGRPEVLDDPVAVETPLEIRTARANEASEPFVVTMRTPGADVELAAGLLYAEGLLERRQDLARIDEASDPDRPLESCVEAVLGPTAPSPARQPRTLLASSACGVCGKAAIDAVCAGGFPTPPEGPTIAAELLGSLPPRMRRAQELFARTGGIHAAALFSPRGELLMLREDVGRHNAVDKVIGRRFLDGEIPLGEGVLAVSGRVGFEIAQKALRAGVPILVAVGAPTSLALELAHRGGMTVAGFARPDRINVYTHPERILLG